jgi:carbamoyltransferase
VQTVSAENGFMSRVLAAHEQQTGIPVLLNTSFNLSEPIVETPAEAIATFQKMPIKTMWLDGYLVQKNGM